MQYLYKHIEYKLALKCSHSKCNNHSKQFSGKPFNGEYSLQKQAASKLYQPPNFTEFHCPDKKRTRFLSG
jgi:hypothetical protein